MSTDTDWTAVRCRLQTLAQEVAEEIRTYPAPIPACDAQFNHLLDLRRALPRELERLEAAMREPGASIEAFIAASPCSADLSAALVGLPRTAE